MKPEGYFCYLVTEDGSVMRALFKNFSPNIIDALQDWKRVNPTSSVFGVKTGTPDYYLLSTTTWVHRSTSQPDEIRLAELVDSIVEFKYSDLQTMIANSKPYKQESNDDFFD